MTSAINQGSSDPFRGGGPLVLALLSLAGAACEPTGGITDHGPQPSPAEFVRGGARSNFDFGTQATFAMGDLQVERDRCTVTGPRARAHCNVYDALFPVHGEITWSPAGRRLEHPLPMLAFVNGVDAHGADAEALLDDPGRWNAPDGDWVYQVATYGQAEARAYFDAAPDDWTDEPLEVSCGGEVIAEALVVYRLYTVSEAELSAAEVRAIIDDVSMEVPPLTIGNGADAVFENAGPYPNDCPPAR